MKSYLISYDLNRPGQNYDALFKAIKAIGPWWHCLDSTWIVKTTWSAKEVVDALRPHIDANDKILATGLNGAAAWTPNFSKECTDYLHNL